MMENRYKELKELLSYPESIALICFNINYSARYSRVNLSVLSGFLGIPDDRLKGIARVLAKLGVVRLYNQGLMTELEMVEAHDDEVKEVIYEVIWENKEQYSFIYRRLLAADYGAGLAMN